MTGYRKMIVFWLAAVLLLMSGCGPAFDDRVITIRETDPETTAPTEQITEPIQPPTQPITQPAVTRGINQLHGSSVRLEGNVVLVSIYVNDSGTSWNFNSPTDQVTVNETIAKLDAAVRYLTAQAARYNKQVTFYYDWRAYRDLGYIASFSENLVRLDTTMYAVQEQWLVNNIDTVYLLNRYAADSILFLFFFNTDYTNEHRAWSFTVVPPAFEQRAAGTNGPLEFSNFYAKYLNISMPAASYAHEILHSFGAHDLYYANRYIPQSYVDYLKSFNASDIMFTVNDAPEIQNTFSDLDAYYAGIAPRPPELQQWGLEISEHELTASY